MPVPEPDEKATATELIRCVKAFQSIRAAPLRALRRDYSRRLTKTSPEKVIAIALRLLEQSGTAFRFLACELVSCHPSAMEGLDAGTVARLGEGMNTWADVDIFACCVAGRAWRTGRINNRVIERWAGSPDRWWRRAAAVSTVPLNMKSQGGEGDARRTLRVCEMLSADRDDMVVKAVSWALRALARRDPGAVRDFVRDHKAALAARVLREVGNKLATGLKNPRRTK